MGSEMCIRDRPMTVQITSVNKALLSVGKLEANGYEVRFAGPGRSFIRDTRTNDRLPMEKRGHVYILRVWVRDDAPAAGFGRQGQQR